ncbi:uncharacterized protein LOC131220229 [Magnolia sinica]|uniref:uncharacterized protein LOC131220229 n=1 Tax=Magnolia sinica TaxID=86752 RepID=UPI002659EED9|nr:uncharacterized protein LOC131220229 [Magnolia sinica]
MTVGESETANIIFNESNNLLCRIAKQSIDAVSCILALRSLAILTFVVGSGEDNAAMLDVLWEVGSYNTADHSDMVSGITDPTREVRAAALSSWAFLLTTVTRDWFDFGRLEEVFPSLLELLRAEDRVVRLSAGEGIVIIFEHLNNLNLDVDRSIVGSAEEAR